MKPSEILIAAKALIADPNDWTQGKYARVAPMFPGDRNSLGVGVLDPDAKCFCSDGAMLRVVGVDHKMPLPVRAHAHYRKAYYILKRVMLGDVYHYNDTSSHAEVLDAFDRAIAKAQEEGL